MSKTQGDTAVQEETEVTMPGMFRVVLHNDDRTTFDFVISLLMELFQKDYQTAVKITSEIHFKGAGEAGIYPYEVAEIKTDEAIRIARAANYPLVATFEPA